VVSCKRHPFTADPTCGECYPSGIQGEAPAPPARDTEPARYSPRDALVEGLLEHLAELPLELDMPSHVEHARRAFTLAVNWYFWNHTKGASSRLSAAPWVVLTEANEHYLSDDALEEAARFFGSDRLIAWQAMTNLVRDLGVEFGLYTRHAPDGFTAEALRARARELVALVKLNQIRIDRLRDAVRGFGVGGLTREARARDVLGADDALRRSWDDDTKPAPAPSSSFPTWVGKIWDVPTFTVFRPRGAGVVHWERFGRFGGEEWRAYAEGHAQT
jgi:hypothetical protein